MNSDLLETIICAGPEPTPQMEVSTIEFIQGMRPGITYSEAAAIWIRLMAVVWGFNESPTYADEPDPEPSDGEVSE